MLLVHGIVTLVDADYRLTNSIIVSFSHPLQSNLELNGKWKPQLARAHHATRSFGIGTLKRETGTGRIGSFRMAMGCGMAAWDCSASFPETISINAGTMNGRMTNVSSRTPKASAKPI